MDFWPFNRYPVKQRVIVNTKTDRAFKGLLYKKTSEYLLLRGATMLHGRDTPVALDGELVIYRENVDFVQVI